MAHTITKDNLFRPMPPKPQSKAEITDSTSRAIIEAEAEKRDAKTRRLRQARLEMEALQAASDPAKDRARKAAKRFALHRTARALDR